MQQYLISNCISKFLFCTATLVTVSVLPNYVIADESLDVKSDDSDTTEPINKKKGKFENRFNIEAGAFFIRRIKATIRLDRVFEGVPVSVGSTVDWTNDLGGENRTTVPRINGYWRFTPQSRLIFGWYDIELEGEAVSRRQIQIGDLPEINIGDTVHSYLKIENYKLAYSYSFYRSKDIETAISAGFHMMDLAAGVSLEEREASEEASGFVPMPLFGFSIDYALSDSRKWWVFSKYDIFFIEFDKSFSGALTDFVLAVKYQPINNLNLTLGFNRFALDVELQKDNYVGTLDYVFNGTMLGLGWNF